MKGPFKIDSHEFIVKQYGECWVTSLDRMCLGGTNKGNEQLISPKAGVLPDSNY